MVFAIGTWEKCYFLLVLYSTTLLFTSSKRCFQPTCLTSSHFSKDLLNSMAPTLATVLEHTQVEGGGSISYEGSPTREHCTRLCSFQGRPHTTFLPFYTSTVTVMSFLRSDSNTVSSYTLLILQLKAQGHSEKPLTRLQGCCAQVKKNMHRCVLQCVNRACISM